MAGLPASYGTPEETESLEIHLEDELTGLSVYLLYTVFEEKDVITRSVRVENRGSKAVELQRVYSCCMDFPDSEFELLHLDGSWARERHIVRQKLSDGIHAVESARGASSHNHNPFIALLRPETREEYGNAYGFSFVYSGNFSAGAEVDQFCKTRVWMGLGSFDFSWKLAPEETFQAPEVVMVYSSDGLGGMSRLYHRFFRENLIHGEYQYKERPVLVNNWEATYFAFNEETIPQIAAGTLTAVPQQHENATLAPMLNKEMAEFHLTDTATHIHNWVRGMNPWPGAWFITSGGKKLKVMSCRVAVAHGEAPGTVLATKPLTVACSEGAIQLLEVVPEGKKPMDGTAFAAGLRLKTGDSL